MESLSFDPTRGFHSIKHELEMVENILNEIPQFREWENVGGIYGIYYKDQLLYVGCSEKMGRRWANHVRHITDKKSLEYYELKYYEMRKVWDKDPSALSFVVLEIVPNENYSKEDYKKNLKKLEKNYTIELKPLFDKSKDSFNQIIIL